MPYISHLMSVSALVLENGGDEDQAIAALLHDAVEDQGGKPTLDTIRHLFGDQVADIVLECSDSDATDPVQKLPSLERKRAYLRHLPTISNEALLVTLADKVHNARSILGDYLQVGDEVWSRFNKTEDPGAPLLTDLALCPGGDPPMLQPGVASCAN